LFLVAILLFLLPLAAYLLILAAINRRDNPTMVSGSWDTLGMLLGASGALLGVGPMLLALLYRRGVIAPDEPVPEFMTLWLRHALLLALYYVLVLCLCAGLIRWRVSKTVFYNVDFDRLQKIVLRVLSERGMECETLGGHLSVARTESSLAEDAIANLPMGLARLGLARRYRSNVSELRLESFPAMQNATLHWDSAEPGLREETENALRKILAEAKIDSNPASSLLMAISGVIFGAVMVALGFFITLQLLSRH